MTCAPSEDSASAQTDQSLRCLHEDTLCPKLPTERTMKALIRLGGYPGSPSHHWAHMSFCWFWRAAAEITSEKEILWKQDRKVPDVVY